MAHFKIHTALDSPSPASGVRIPFPGPLVFPFSTAPTEIQTGPLTPDLLHLVNDTHPIL